MFVNYVFVIVVDKYSTSFISSPLRPEQLRSQPTRTTMLSQLSAGNIVPRNHKTTAYISLPQHRFQAQFNSRNIFQHNCQYMMHTPMSHSQERWHPLQKQLLQLSFSGPPQAVQAILIVGCRVLASKMS